MMGRIWLPKEFISDLRGLRDGNPDSTELLSDGSLSWLGFEWHSRAIAGSAKVCWVVDIRHGWYLQKGFLSELDSYLRRVNAFQTSLNDWLESGRPTLLYSLAQYIWSLHFLNEPSEAPIPSYAVVVTALVLLSLVFQYLTGNVDRGGSKAYSRTSLDFRDIYVAIVLFLGAYVWIKFREVAFKGVHRRKLVDKHGGTKVVYVARLTPPMWKGKKVSKLDLGQFATPQDAHNKFLIAAFYYGRAGGLLDGWFQVPSMSEEERSLSGEEKRKWVITQAKKVYEDFKKGTEADAALLQGLFEACEGQATQERVEVNVNPCGASLSNSAERQQPALVSQAENSGMGVGMIGDNHGLECASHSFDGMHEGLALPNGRSLGSRGGFALPVSQQPPNTESGMSLNGSDQSDSLQTLVRTLQQQNFDLQQQIRELGAQILQLKQQQSQESRIQNPQWPCQFRLQQLLHDGNQGFPSFEVEMDQSMHEQNYSGFMAQPPDGGEVQEAFWEMGTLW